MSGSVSKTIICGNVGKDPEIRTMQSGSKMASLSIATSQSWRDKETGEKKERTEWHRIVVWSAPLVEVIEKFVKKGSKLYVEGANQTRKYTDSQGIERYTTEVVLQGFNAVVVLLDKPPSNRPPPPSEDEQTGLGYGGSHTNDTGSGFASHSEAKKPINSATTRVLDDPDDEIPF